jgi:alanine racemase
VGQVTVTKLVNLETYRENLRVICETVAPAEVMAVVKADGYGHGLIETAKAAEDSGVRILGVLDIESGIKIRRAGVKSALFAWLHSPQSNFELAVKAGIELSVSSIRELNSIASVAGVAKVHLKLDTGLSRNGCRIENWKELVAEAIKLQNQGEVQVVAIWSHLAGASIHEDRAALEVFESGTEQAKSLGFHGYRHIASSPAAFALPEARLDLVRIGVSAFGTSPIAGTNSSELGLGNPLRLVTEVHSPGVISIGYLHGYFSTLSGKSKVSIAGSLYRVLQVGPLASTIEPGPYEQGDEVLVIDDDPSSELSAESLCELVDTVTDELFTGLKANLATYSG